MDPPNKRRRLLPAPAAAQAPPPPQQMPQPKQASPTAAAPVPTPATTPQTAQYPPEQTRQHYPVQTPPPSDRHDFESFARHLQDAAMFLYGKMQRRSRYKNASVLLLRWEEDVAVEPELLALEKVFRERYNYHTDKWAIPTCPNPSIKLSVQMASFIEHARSDHLLIIYYAGHSYVGADKQVYWSNARNDACRVKWSGVRCLFEDAQSDILLLLDTCAVHDSPVSGSNGTKEAIAAYSPDQKAPDHPARSFSSYLAESLYNLSSGRPNSVPRLYDEIMRLRQQHTAAAKPVNGSGPKPHPERAPTLFTLTKGKEEHITLAPLTQRGSPAREGQPTTDTNGQDSNQSFSLASGTVPDLTFDEARVLVCTTFVGDASADMMFYNQWLQNTPPLASKITMEGMFLGPPTMLLVSMPLSVWNVVQHDKVCCFLGYINSHNMIDLYKGLVQSTPPAPRAPPQSTPTLPVHPRAVEDGRVLLEASKIAANSPNIKRRHEAIAQQAASYSEHVARQEAPARNPLPNSAPPVTVMAAAALGRDNVEASAEMKEAAEQLNALSHVRHVSDGGLSSGGISRLGDSPASMDHHDSMMDDHPKPLLPAPRKPLAKAQPRFDTRCTLCSHAPFKDSSSLRKHIAAAHTRPFPCAFSFAGCTSTFGSKNEWKRHISSQHLCLQFYRCSQCPSSAAEGKGNEFNRKDLFTQHLRRMHAPFAIKKAIAKGDSKLHNDWESHVKGMQTSCLVTRREPPQHVACPKPDCNKEFEGHIAWDEWTEHVGRHMEKGDGLRIGVDTLLAKWALEEGIIERLDNGTYRFCAMEEANGFGMRRDSLVNGSFVSDTPMPDEIDKNEEKVEASVMPEAQQETEPEPEQEPEPEPKPVPGAEAEAEVAHPKPAEAEDPEPEPEPERESEREESGSDEKKGQVNNKIQPEPEPEVEDPDSIVVATSTAMHDRMETDD